MLIKVNDNAIYHVIVLDGMSLAIPIARKRIKAFKKQHEDEPDPGAQTTTTTRSERTKIRRATGEREPVFSGICASPAHTSGCAVWWGWMS